MGEKYFFWNAIPNLILVCGLIYYLYIRKNIAAILVAVFVYISLHGGYAVFAAATADGINTMNQLHYVRSDLGVKILGSTFLLGCCLLVGLGIKNQWVLILESILIRWEIIAAMVLYVVFMSLGAINLPQIKNENILIILKELIFSIVMWIAAIAFSVVINQGRDFFNRYRVECFFIPTILVLIMIAVGIYEIINGLAWAGTLYRTGYSWRASATLFNPNVFGFWAAMMALAVSFFYHLGLIRRSVCFVAMTLTFTCILLASSRTGLILAIVVLFIANMITCMCSKYDQRNITNKAWPLISFLMAFIFYFISLNYITLGSLTIFDTLRVNLLRFIDFPHDLISLLRMKLASISFINQFFNYLNIDLMSVRLDGRELMSINESWGGRTSLLLNSDGSLVFSDNSFLYIYAIGGFQALFCWAWIWVIALYIGYSKLKTSPTIYSAYAFAGLIFCLLSSVFLRTPQLFPLWIFNSMLIGFCLNWWASPNNVVIVTNKYYNKTAF